MYIETCENNALTYIKTQKIIMFVIMYVSTYRSDDVCEYNIYIPNVCEYNIYIPNVCEYNIYIPNVFTP